MILNLRLLEDWKIMVAFVVSEKLLYQQVML